MARAVNELVKEPQNNLRVFRNGTPIYGDGIVGQDFETICKDMFGENTDKRSVVDTYFAIGGILFYLACLQETIYRTNFGGDAQRE